MNKGASKDGLEDPQPTTPVIGAPSGARVSLTDPPWGLPGHRQLIRVPRLTAGCRRREGPELFTHRLFLV